jgi:hypothetical protein
MGGGGLFGPKRWMDWRLNAANMNFYRPNQVAAYWPPPPLPSTQSLYTGGTQGYNQFSDQLNLPPYSTSNTQLPSTGTNTAYGQTTSSQLSNTIGNDGWSYPSVSPYSRPTGQTSGSGQSSYAGGDSYTVSPNSYQPAKQQASPYGTKGGSGNKTAKR